jgi:hypothetical protein
MKIDLCYTSSGYLHGRRSAFNCFPKARYKLDLDVLRHPELLTSAYRELAKETLCHGDLPWRWPANERAMEGGFAQCSGLGVHKKSEILHLQNTYCVVRL